MLLNFTGSCAHKVNSVRTRLLRNVHKEVSSLLDYRTEKPTLILADGPFSDLLVQMPYYERLCAYILPEALEVVCCLNRQHIYVCWNGKYKYYTHEEFEKLEQSTEFENSIVWLGELLKVQ